MGCVWAYKRRLHRRCNHLPFLSSWWTKCLETKDLEAQKVVVPWLFLKSNCWHHLDGGNSTIFYVHLYLGKMNPFWENIFQMSWFNQPTSHAMPPTLASLEVCSDSQRCVSKTCDEQSRCFLALRAWRGGKALGKAWETLKETPRYSGIFDKCIWGIHPFLRGFFMFHFWEFMWAN